MNLRWASEKGILITILQKRKLRLREESESQHEAVVFKVMFFSSVPQGQVSCWASSDIVCLRDAVSLAIT